MKTIYTTLPIYNKLAKQCFERGKRGGVNTPTPIITPRHRLPAFQWSDEDISIVDTVDMIGTEGDINLITGWTNAAPNAHYSTLVTDGPDITSAKNLAGFGVCYATTNAIPVLYGMQYTITINVTVAAGVAPDLHATGASLYNPNHELIDGENIITYFALTSGNAVFYLYADAGDEFSATFDFRGTDITGRYWYKAAAYAPPIINGTYDTFTSTATEITSAIKTVAAGVEYCYSNVISIAEGDYIRMCFTLDLNSGTAPVCVLVDSTGADKSNVVQLKNGLNAFILISTVTDANCRIRFRNGDTELSNYSMIFSISYTLSDEYIKPYALTGEDYFQYKGDTLTRLLPDGKYYLRLLAAESYIYYSDWFMVDCVYPNLINELINGAYETFTSSGTSIISAIETGASGVATSTLNSFSVIKDESITFLCYLSLNSGELPYISIRAGYVTGVTYGDYVSNIVQLSEGLNEITLTITDTRNDAYLYIYNTGASNFTTSDIFLMREYSEKYLTLKFSNECDLGDILYADGFEQHLWFESETMESTYPQEEEGVKNGESRFVRSFARQVKKYLAKTNVMPDYMVDVFNRLKLHDNIEMTDLVGDVNNVYNLEVENEWLWDDRYYARLELTFDYDEAVVIGGCCNDMT